MKKGVSKILMTIVLMIVILIGSIAFSQTIFENYNRNKEQTACQKSIIAHTTMLKLTDGNYAPAIECPTIYKTIKKSTTKENIKFILAEDMRIGWNLWVNRSSELFVGEEGVFCHIYKVNRFEKKGLVIDDFEEFLETETIPGSRVKYLEHIAPKMTEGLEGIEDRVEVHELTELEPFVINTDNDYAIIFKTIKGKDKLTIFGKEIKLQGEVLQKEDIKQNGLAFGVGAGALIGGTAGAKIGAFFGLFCGPASLVCVPLYSAGGAIIGMIFGAAGGGILYTLYVDPNDPQNSASYIMIKPFTEEGIEYSGCDYLPVSQTESTG